MTESSQQVPRALGAVKRLAVFLFVCIGLYGGAVESLTVEVHRKTPHDPEAFTQGLVWWQGKLYESTGRRGRSDVRRIDPATGAVERRVPIPLMFFGEGLARDGGRLVMLTWHAEQAFVFALDDLDRRGSLGYRGEGWGLCHDGERFVMSDGSDRLVFRDSETFEVVGDVPVMIDGTPLHYLNELECAHGEVYANVLQRDVIVRIDPGSGRVTARIDASGLLAAGEAKRADVLNGIAYAPEKNRFFLTGKLWPWMFEVTFGDGSGEAVDDATIVEP